MSLGVWLGIPSRASASFALHWVRAPGADACIDPRTLAERVEAFTGRVWSTASDAEYAIEGLIRPHDSGFQVRLTLAGSDLSPSKERILSSASPDCRGLDSVVAFVIALSIDPHLSISGIEPGLLAQFAEESPEGQLLAELPQAVDAPFTDRTAPPVASSAAEGAPEDAAPAEDNAQQTEHAVPRSTLTLAPASLVGTLPAWMPGFSGSYALRFLRPLAVEGSGQVFFSTSPEALARATRARFRDANLMLAACPIVPRKTGWELRGCLGTLVSWLGAEGTGFEHNRRAVFWDVALTLGLKLRVSLRRGFGLSAFATARLRLTQKSFDFTEAGQPRNAFTPRKLGVMLGLGPTYEF